MMGVDVDVEESALRKCQRRGVRGSLMMHGPTPDAARKTAFAPT